jgi:hypothetical protein
MSCWNVGTTCSWGPGKKVPGSERLVAWQVKRLVLSGVIPTIQQQRELFRAFHTLSIKKSDNVKKLNHIYFMSCWNVEPRRTTTEPFGFVVAMTNQTLVWLR